LVVVTGVPGSGKSTVISGALRELKQLGIDYSLLNFGDVMLEIMREKDGVTNRDDMRKIPVGRYREVQREAAMQIARAAAQKPVLLDTHCLIKKPEGYYPGLPRWVLDELKPDSIVLVEASPREIAGRRMRDATRQRDEDLEEIIDEHQQMNRAAAMAYSAFSGASVSVIQNRDKGLNKAIEELVSALR
jgi:adenylate kinase